MTAYERAATSLEFVADGADEVEQSPKAKRKVAGLRSPAVLFVQDVVEGVRCVSHNALAMVGLTAVVAVLFLMGRADVRYSLEGQALTWLMERAHLRDGTAGDEADAGDGELLAMAEPEAIQRATATNPSELNRQQSAVAYWISRRYNVAPEPISRLVQEAWEVGRRVNLEPTLVLAVMAVESGFNPFAQSHVGAQGLMQVMTRVHSDKYQIFGGQNAAFDPVTNLRVGVQVLKECIRKAGSLEGGLKYYVGAANLVDDGGYAAKVLAEQGYLRQVANGVKLPVTVSLPQAVVQADVPAVAPAAAAKAGSAAANPAAGVSPVVPAASEAAPAAHRTEQVALLTPTAH
ncbi:MAG TPA: lytic transglycosylase domain-containing protein [Aquabacterium sp.]|uniref:lytic transglycosylase domain-containing protein n=1 Tax=Aquabacterium sp. TaxID=1872578 RepID=UPI002E30D99D|nr:lytic transglycosylase domain-containing protein [Aquabacterium sp.]HEX5357729.1 lytic transglycosylase domain-containing protein [Aquabacterium sp.]